MEHFGARSSLRALSTALLLTGADRAVERKRRNGESKVMALQGESWGATTLGWAQQGGSPSPHRGIPGLSATPGLWLGQRGVPGGIK